MIDRAPEYVTPAEAALQPSREAHAFTIEAAHDSAGRTCLSIGVEQELQRATDPSVRVEYDRAIEGIDQPHRQRYLQLTAARLVAHAPLQARLQDVQLGLAHRALQSEQQPVVEVSRIVDSILVED